jgi:hypothetical protein
MLQMAGARSARSAVVAVASVAARMAQRQTARQQQPTRVPAGGADAGTLGGHEGRAGYVIQGVGRSSRQRFVAAGGNAIGEGNGTLGQGRQFAAHLTGNGRLSLNPIGQGGAQVLVRADLRHRARRDIQGVDVGRAFPQQPDLSVADQASVHEVFDVTIPATHLHRPGRDRDVVAAGAELVDRRQDAQQVRSVFVTFVSLAHRVGGEGVHGKRLLGRQHDLHDPHESRVPERRVGALSCALLPGIKPRPGLLLGQGACRNKPACLWILDELGHAGCCIRQRRRAGNRARARSPRAADAARRRPRQRPRTGM